MREEVVTAVQEIVSDNGQYKAVVERRHDSKFQVTLWKWTRSEPPEQGHAAEPFWSLISRGITLTNTLADAQRLALEKLADIGAICGPNRR